MDSPIRWLVRRRHMKLYRGWFAWELQVGPLVLQLVHPEHRDSLCAEGRRFIVWLDRYADSVWGR